MNKLHLPRLRGFTRVIATGLLVFNVTYHFAQFTAGNLVVLQAGDGGAALVNTGNRIVLKEFSSSGAATFSVGIPVSGSPLVIGGSASSEGGLSLSSNGEYLVFGGYAQALPNSTALSGATAATVNRGVGIVDAAGNFTRVASSASFFSGNNIRGAASDGNNNYWASGSNNGTDYFGLNHAAATVQNAVTNSRYIAVIGSSVYFSCGSGTCGIYKTGTSGLPFTTGQGATLIINTTNTGSGAAGSYGFYFNTAQTICYIADDRNPGSGGGIQKWVYSAGSWSLAYTLPTGATYGARGVVADFSGPNPKVFATTSEGSSNRLIAINDAGANSTPTTLATSGSNTLFRGLAFSPYCSNPQITTLGTTAAPCAAQSLTLNASITGPGPFSYTWAGPSGFAAAVPNPTLFNATSGNYSLSITNGCGDAAFSTLLTIYPLPQITVNAALMCTGGSATLNAAGAASYTWNTGSNAAAISVSPAVSTVFTISAASAQGCVTSVTTAVQVVTALTLSVNSPSLCVGASVLLNASGAGSYTWSPGTVSSSVVVSPTLSTIYTVTGTASGCVSAASATALVTVYALPPVLLTGTAACAGTAVSLAASGASSYSWNTAASDASITIQPLVTTAYTVTGFSAQGCSNQAVATVTVFPLPSVLLDEISSPLCVDHPAITLNGTPAGGTYTGAALSGNSFDPTTAGAGSFTLSYTYTDNQGCSSMANKVVMVDLCTAQTDRDAHSEFKIYPNPAASTLQLLCDNFYAAYHITIQTVDGKILFTRQITKAEVQIDLEGLLPGIYLLKMVENPYTVVKFVKE